MNVFTPDRVTLEMSRERYNELMMLLGYATGHAIANGFSLSRCLAVVNELNEGNPDWTPYAVEEEPS